MINQPLNLIALAIITAFLAACTAQDPVNSTPWPVTLPGSALTGELPAGCRPDAILLDNLRAQLPYEQAVITYQSYRGEHTLVIWLAANALGSPFPEENQQQALEIAVNSAEILLGASVCVAKLDLLHITVVDTAYTQWFSGPIRPGDLAAEQSANTGGGIAVERGGGVDLVAADPVDPPLNSDCDWTLAKAGLEAKFSDLGFRDEFYFVRHAGENLVYVHWVLPGKEDPESLLPLLEQIAEQVSCLYPRPTGISLTIAGEDGVVRLSGYLPGELLHRKTKFNLDDLSYQLLGDR